MRRTQRLFALTEHLRGRRTGVTAEALAKGWGGPARTPPRARAAPRPAPRPAAAAPGRGGGYALDRHYSLPPVNFTAREAALLIAVGTHAISKRLVPFSATLASALDKVRAALSTSAQRELLERLDELSFLGVPALPYRESVRAAVEHAWFEQQPLAIIYVDGDLVETKRRIRIRSILMERHETRLDAEDLDTGERRHFRLDRVTRARVLKPEPPPVTRRS